MRASHHRALACHSIDDLRRAAQRTLPRMVFDFVDGAAQTESTHRANLEALERYRLIASGPVDVHERSTAINLFGTPARAPLIIGPTGFAGALWPKGDLALARAAARFGIPFVISFGANASLEELTQAADGRIWLNLYISSSRERTLRLLRKAQSLGIEAIEVTVDTALPGRRLRDIRNGFGVPFTWTARKLLDVLRHPGWALRSLPGGMPTPGLIDVDFKSGQKWDNIAELVRSQINPAACWEDLKWLRDEWPGRLIIKGLVDVEQVPHVLSTGYDAVVVSNHGGRQLDGAVATVDVLPDFVAAINRKIPIFIDGGFRSGTDVLKAVALGATAVQLGRATLYGLAVAGEAGVDRALSLMHLELDLAMALTGLTQLPPDRTHLLWRSPETASRSVPSLRHPPAPVHPEDLTRLVATRDGRS